MSVAPRLSVREILHPRSVAVFGASEDKGKAVEFNRLELLRDLLGLKRSQVELIAGATSRDKKFLIRGLTRHDLAARLAALA